VVKLESLNGLKFENDYTFSKSLYQPKYEYLEKLIKRIKRNGTTVKPKTNPLRYSITYLVKNKVT